MNNQNIELEMAIPKVSDPTEQAIGAISYKDSEGSIFNGAEGIFYLQKPGQGTFVINTKMQQVSCTPIYRTTSPSSGVWDEEVWESSDNDYDESVIRLNPFGTWIEGFRPTAIRCTIFKDDPEANILLSIMRGDTEYGFGEPYISGAQVPLDFNQCGEELDEDCGDIERLICERRTIGTGKVYLTNVEFLVDGEWEPYFCENDLT